MKTMRALINLVENKVADQEVFPRRNLFHAAPESVRASIRMKGIEPSTGGTTFLDRTYSARVHLTVRKDAADDFTMSVNARRGRDAIRYDIYEIDPTKMKGATFYMDPFYDDYGIWTASLVPPSAIVGMQEVDHDWEPDDDYYDGVGADHKVA